MAHSPRRDQRPILWNRQNALALAVFLSCLLFCGWLLVQPDSNLLTPTGLIQVIRAAGFWGLFIYIGVLALSVIISPIPGAPLAIAAGAVWGALPAAIYSVIGGFLGSLIAYYIGRTLGRSAIQALTGKAIYFSQRRGEVFLGWLIFLTRLFPVIPFDLISYGAGMTGMTFSIYATATLLGMIPSTFFLTYIGSTTISLPQGIAIAIVFLAFFLVVPWGIRKYNWFGLRDVVRVE